jgi:hypothetical protein
VVAQLVKLAPDSLFHGQLLIGVAFVQDQLFPNRGGGQARVQPLRLERWVGLALAIDEGLDVGEQLRKVFFSALASAQAEGIKAADARRQFVHPFADGHPIPAQFAFGSPLPIRAEATDRSCHEETPIRTAQRVSSPV